MKKKIPILFITVLVIYSCSEKRVPVVGFLIPNLSDQRYHKDTTYFCQRAREAGFKVIAQEAGNDPKTQEKQAANLINEGMDLLVISAVNQNLAANIIRNAHENKIPVIAYERLIKNCDLDYLVTFDHKKVGELQAKYISDRCRTGNYVIFGGDKRDRNAEMIYEGQMKILKPLVSTGTIKIIYTTFIEDWSPENAGFELENILKLSPERIDAILSANDGMAGALLKVCENRGEDSSVLCTGLDADKAACMRIAKQKQIMTVYKPLKKMAYITVELAAELLIKGKVKNTFVPTFNGYKEVNTILLEPMVIDKDNLKAIIIKDEFFTEAEIFSK